MALIWQFFSDFSPTVLPLAGNTVAWKHGLVAAFWLPFMVLMITAEHVFCLQVTEVFWRQYSIEHTRNCKGFMLCRRKQEVGEWRYLPLTEAILTRQAVQSVKEQMRDWNRANALHCTTSCSMVSSDWSLFCFRALIHWLIDAFKPSRSLWALFLLPLWLIFKRDVRFLKSIVEISGSKKGTGLGHS